MNTEERVPRIGEIRILVKPDYYLGRAHKEQANGNNIGAIQNYISYLENLSNLSDMRVVEQVNLTKLIINLAEITDATREAEDEIMKCFIVMLNHFPQNVLILNAFSVYLFSRGEYNVARGYLQRAAAEDYLPAEKNLLHVLWHLIPRWHFRMLNDKVRNQSYESAIHKAIHSGYKDVYDIGTGCGLLTLIAATCDKNVKVTAFEENKTLYSIAERIFKAHDLRNVNFLLKNSNDVKEAPTPCNLIVTEIFDAALFGENCLESIKHALDCFVNKKEFKIIPASAKLYVTALESHKITKKFRYTGTLKEMELNGICIQEIDSEPYDTEYLRKQKHIKYITETKVFLKVDFYSKSQLEAMSAVGSDYFIDEIELICLEDGTIHAWAVWFDLGLDEEIAISTNPFDSGIKCWEQAIFHLDHPISVRKNETIKLRPKIMNGQIHFNVVSHQHKCGHCFKVSKDIISFLNDSKLVDGIVHTVDTYKDCDIRIVDFSVFPLFGFLMAKKGATVYHIYKEDCDLILFRYLMDINQLSKYKFIFVHEKAVEEHMVLLESPHIVYTDLVKTDGSWNRIEFPLETETKLNCATVPKKIFLKAQLIHSPYLDVCNKVFDSNALNFKIAQHMNDFSGTEHPNIESLGYEQYSSVAVFDISELDAIDFHAETEISRDGKTNSIFYWFDMVFTDDDSVTFSTLDSSHYNKTCTIFKDLKEVKKGEKIMIHVLRTDGYLKVYCD